MKILNLTLCLFFSLAAAVFAEEKKEGEGGGGEQKSEAAPTSPNINLPPLIIPVLQQGEVKAFYSSSLVLQAVDLEHAEELQHYVARITDAIYTDLYVFLGIFWDKDIEIGATVIEERAKAAAMKVCKSKILKDVVINDFHAAPNLK